MIVNNKENISIQSLHQQIKLKIEVQTDKINTLKIKIDSFLNKRSITKMKKDKKLKKHI